MESGDSLSEGRPMPQVREEPVLALVRYFDMGKSDHTAAFLP